MPVSVVDVWIMGVAVLQRLVLVEMVVGFATVPGEIVRMLVMCVVHMPVSVREGCVRMQVLVPFCKV